MQLVSSQTPIATQNYLRSVFSYSPHFSTPWLLSAWPSPLCMFSNFSVFFLVDYCLLLYDLWIQYFVLVEIEWFTELACTLTE